MYTACYAVTADAAVAAAAMQSPLSTLVTWVAAVKSHENLGS